MALSNSQYDQLMRDYEQLQLDNEHELRLHFDEVYAKIPKRRTIDDTISSLSVEKAKRLGRYWAFRLRVYICGGLCCK